MVDVQPFRTVDNTTILNAIRKTATTDYQRRIPNADKAHLQDTINSLVNFRPQMNEFIDALVNRIGLEIYKYNTWTNPLSIFKRGMLEYGDTIEEVMVGLLEAHSYDSDREYLEGDIFGQERPDVQTSFHKVNRQDWYKISINEPLLKRAFLSEFGLSGFVTQLMQAPTTSDSWDEFLLMAQLFKEYDNAGGFFNINVPDVGSITGDSGAAAKIALRSMRETAENLKFISTRYNASGMPVAANADDLVLFVTPEADAGMDVEALAAAFNLGKAEFGARKQVIPIEHFPAGTTAILTTKDFFVVADQNIQTTSQPNPVGLHTNYFLHHWQVISASRFVPAIKFSTLPSTPIIINSTPVTAVAVPTLTDENGVAVTNGDVIRGEFYQLDTVVTNSNGDNDAVRYDLAGALSLRTKVTQTGVLYVAPDEASESLTVTATAVDNEGISSVLSVTVVGDLLILWPTPEVLPDADLDGLLEVTPAAIVKDASDNVTIPEVVGVQYQENGTNVTNGSVVHITASTAFTAVARAGYELAAGATASWTILP